MNNYSSTTTVELPPALSRELVANEGSRSSVPAAGSATSKYVLVPASWLESEASNQACPTLRHTEAASLDDKYGNMLLDDIDDWPEEETQDPSETKVPTTSRRAAVKSKSHSTDKNHVRHRRFHRRKHRSGLKQYVPPVQRPPEFYEEQRRLCEFHRAAKLEASRRKSLRQSDTQKRISAIQGLESRLKKEEKVHIKLNEERYSLKGYPEEIKDLLRHFSAINHRDRVKDLTVKHESNLRSDQDASFETRIAELRSADLSRQLQLLRSQEKSKQRTALEQEMLEHWAKPHSDLLYSPDKYAGLESFSSTLQFENELKQAVWNRYQRVTPDKFKSVMRNKRKVIEAVDTRENNENERYFKSKLARQHDSIEVPVFYPFVESSSSEQKSKIKLPELNTHNVIEWKKKVAIELRAENPNFTIVLQYSRPRWYSAEEEAKIRALLHPVVAPNVAVDDLHEAVVDQLYRRAPATAAYNLIDFQDREEKYYYFNCKLHGLIEKACSNSIQAQVFLEKRLDDFQSAGGDMTRLNGRNLLDSIVELFNRDTIRTKGEKLKTFYTRTMSDFKRGMDLVTTLEKDSIELVRLGEFSLDSVEPKLIDRFIDAINDEPRYLGLVGHLRSQREDLVNGLTWTKVKSIVKKDDIDRDTDRLRKAKRSRDHREHDHQGSAPAKRHNEGYSKICHNCGKKGHIASECRSKSKAMPATGKAPGKYGPATDQPKPAIRCYKCGGPHYTNKCGLSRKVTAGAHSCVDIPQEYYHANDEEVIMAVMVSDNIDEVTAELRARFGVDFGTQSECAISVDNDNDSDYYEDSFEGNSHWASSSAFDAYADELADHSTVYEQIRLARIEAKLRVIRERIIDFSGDIFIPCEVNLHDDILSAPMRWRLKHLSDMSQEHPLIDKPIAFVMSKECMIRELKETYPQEDDSDDDDHHNMPKKMKASADHISKRHNQDEYDDDSDDEKICASASIDCELQSNDKDDGWEVTMKTAKTVIYPGTSLRNHELYVTSINTNETLYTGVAKVAFAAHRDSQNAVSLLDSGASKCMFKDRSMFDYLKKTSYGISTASSSLTVREAGPVKCIEEAYYLPSASHDLISIGDLDHLGCKTVIEGGILTISRNGEEITSIQKSNNVWTAYTTELLDGVLSTMSAEERANMWWLPKA